MQYNTVKSVLKATSVKQLPVLRGHTLDPLEVQ